MCPSRSGDAEAEGRRDLGASHRTIQISLEQLTRFLNSYPVLSAKAGSCPTIRELYRQELD